MSDASRGLTGAFGTGPQEPSGRRQAFRMPVILLLCAALLVSAVARVGAENRRLAATPELARVGGSDRIANLGQLNSFTLALLLGGLRGPLVMALWSTSETQRMERDLRDLETQIELIRLLQPQFDSVHLYQVWNKSTNLPAELVSLSARYSTILDAILYAQRVLRERPNSIDMETQLGEVFANRLGEASEGEREYYHTRIHEDTKADEPVLKLRFATAREAEIRRAALQAGVSPRVLTIQRTQDPTRMVAAVRISAGERMREQLGEEEIEYEILAPRQADRRGVGGPQRLPAMLDEDGRILPQLLEPSPRLAGAGELGKEFDGSDFGFLQRFEPFPEGVSPFALAYEHFRRARALQRHAGQRTTHASYESVDVNPGRALRGWSMQSYHRGRQAEMEAFGLDAPAYSRNPEVQTQLEVAVVFPMHLGEEALGPDEPVPAPEMLREAIGAYERSLSVGREALAELEAHVERFPQAIVTFTVSIARLRDLQVLLEADTLYARLHLGEVEDRSAAMEQARELYRQADGRMRDFVVRYHTSQVEEVLPPGVSELVILEQPDEVREEVYRRLSQLRDRDPFEFPHTDVLDEFDGYRLRISRRLELLEDAAARLALQSEQQQRRHTVASRD